MQIHTHRSLQLAPASPRGVAFKSPNAWTLSAKHVRPRPSSSRTSRPLAVSCDAELQSSYATRMAAAISRRACLQGGMAFGIAMWTSKPAWAAAGIADSIELQRLEALAFDAYSNRDFQGTVNTLTDIINIQPENTRWFEMRAQVLVDGKNFDGALQDFNQALSLTPSSDLITRARLLSGRGLAYEGISDWQAALKDYDAALELANKGGESPDPYVVNSRGNCKNSLEMWQAAREDYLASSQLFQQAKGFRGPGGSTTARLDGAIFAASNAALMLAQMGDEVGAIKEMERIARRAPGSADMRAALAALYWSQGRVQSAEDEWEFACDKISVGCTKYQDKDWLVRIRRWPPMMAQRMQDFLSLNKPALQVASTSAT